VAATPRALGHDEFGLRIGANPQVIATSTPRGLPFLRKLEAEPTTVTTRAGTWENAGTSQGRSSKRFARSTRVRDLAGKKSTPRF